MKLLIGQSQYNAISDIYCPPEDVYYLIMTAIPKNGKYLLEGSEDTFESLIETINEEICEDLCTLKNQRSLVSLCKKIDPSCLEWIGM